MTDTPRARLVLFGGQSNMLGHRLATGGDKPVSARVWAWDNGGAEGSWRRAELGLPHFNPLGDKANNAALHFAVRLAERLDEDVYLVGHAVNGSSILTWEAEAAENLSRLITETNHALHSAELVAAGIDRVDTVLWHQGESDDPEAWMVPAKLTTLADYRAAFQRMRAALARQPWWTDATCFIAGELVRDGWLSARNDFYSAGALNGPRDAVASSEGLGHTGDHAHLDGQALQTLGRRMYDARVGLL
ncbi:sialate O-acetylesterase [Nocardioides humilatus]|uniref:Sialate O-acetylesterase n=1 Tax=Nocardioides humilatus TaxID=2607660 RepID=A0A5B1LCW1_9ACTN|nr:sialate O-acetylesterase [Nocardioides humilatus]KAA1418591.1 sialate O-acetylesterase [Nocardioides humilatus]